MQLIGVLRCRSTLSALRGIVEIAPTRPLNKMEAAVRAAIVSGYRFFISVTKAVRMQLRLRSLYILVMVTAPCWLP